MTLQQLCTFGKRDRLNQAEFVSFLSAKFKLLVAMAFDAAAGAEGGVTALANVALQEGATKEEIAETLRVVYHLTGVGALYTASRALREVVQEK